MMKVATTSFLEIRHAEFTHEFLVVALDAPALFRHVDEREERGV